MISINSSSHTSLPSIVLMSYNKELNNDFAVFFLQLLRNGLVGVKNEFLFLVNEDLQGISRFCDYFLLLNDMHFLG